MYTEAIDLYLAETAADTIDQLIAIFSVMGAEAFVQKHSDDHYTLYIAAWDSMRNNAYTPLPYGYSD